MRYHFVYRTNCIKTGKYYLGMHSTNDLNDGYLGSGIRLKASIQKYGFDKHTREIFEWCANRELLEKREAEIITEERLNDPSCLNIAYGGQGGKIVEFTHEHRRKISESLVGNQRSKKKRTNETKKKISEARKGKSRPKFSDEWRQNISEAAKKRFKSSSERDKISQKMREKWKNGKYRTMMLNKRSHNEV